MNEINIEWQQRTELLLGKDKMKRLRHAHVLVVGLGGVGAYAAEMICRAGVGRMTIVDADIVQPSNINRQSFGPLLYYGTSQSGKFCR